MPITVGFDVEYKVAYVRAWGVLTDEEMYALEHTGYADPRFEPSFRQFSDFSDVTVLRVTAAGIRAIAGLNPFGAGARRALLAGSDEDFGVARQYETQRHEVGDEVVVFRDRDAALQWLGLPPDWTPPAAAPGDGDLPAG